MLGYSGVVLVSLNLIMYGDDQAESVATIFEICFLHGHSLLNVYNYGPV